MWDRLRRWAVGPSESEIRAAYPAARGRIAPQPIISVSGGRGLPLPIVPPSMFDRNDALAVPVISRARDLMAGFLGSLPLRAYQQDWTDQGMVERDVQPPVWAMRLDPAKPKTHTIGGLVDDLFFYGIGYLAVLERFAAPSDYPKSMRWVPADEVTVQEDEAQLYWTPTPRSGFYTGRSSQVRIPFRDVIEFTSPFVPLLVNGTDAITTYRNLQGAVDRFSTVSQPTGVLRQTDGEPLTADERREEATSFTANRLVNATAFLPQGVVYEAQSLDPERLQLVDARTYQSLELARLSNIPGSLLDIAISSMTYTNQRDSLTNLWYFGLLPVATAMGQVFSGPNVTPRGTWVGFDPTVLLGQPGEFAGANPASPPAPNPPSNVRQLPGQGPTGQVRQRPADTAAK